MGRREDDHLPVVHAHIAAQLVRPLERVEERSGDGPTHDLETCDRRIPSIAVEVKELVPGEFRAVGNQVSREQRFDSKVLAKRWSVIVMEEALSSRLAPMPRFPDDPPPEEIRRLALDGFVVVTKTEREEQWRSEHTLAPRAQLRIKNLAKDIEGHLAVLERLGIVDTRRHGSPPASPLEFQTAQKATWAVRRRTHDSLCRARDPVAAELSGIDINFGYGSVRTGRADAVAIRVQMWLDSELPANLIASLTRSAADEGHAALWLSTEAESQSAQEQGASFCPTLSMSLPEGLDVLWIFVEPVALRYDGSWTAAMVTRPPVS
jgi:hypothetical protein